MGRAIVIYTSEALTQYKGKGKIGKKVSKGHARGGKAGGAV
jgi:hypothetical protein